ncbi:FecR domain-containing protein [Neptuniibacter marinus]|uniref:FecR domain-containing protein n=1 Tax=Neptuniibacter marinus TaxID=1806670 RepID=UPI003B5A1C95
MSFKETHCPNSVKNIFTKHLYKTSYWKQLQKINNIADPKRIPENTKLRIPIHWIKSQPASAQVIKFEGDVVTRNQEGTDSQQVSVGQQLNLGDHLETYSQSSVLIRFADGSEIRVLQNSKIDFNHMTKYGETGMVDSRIRLISGDVESHAETQKGSASRFEIHTPAAISAVRGTRFRTSYTADDTSSNIEVLEGGVAVRGAKTTRLVRAGYGTHVVKNKAPLKPKKLLPAPKLLAYPQPIETIGSQIRWEAIEGAQRYRFIIAESNEFSTVLWDSDSERNAISLPDLSDDIYFLQLRAVDKHGIEGIERVQTFTLNAHPQPPFPMAPNNKATIRGEAPVLEWTQSSEAVSYRLQIASDQQFSNILLDRPSLTSNQFTASELLPTNTYYWRVASLAGDGELGPYSTQRSLTIKPIPATPEPALVQNEREIKLSWALGLPDESYQIQISKDPAFKSIITDSKLTKPEITLERPEGYRYVRVRSLAEDGFAGAWGVTQELTPPPNDNWIYVFGSFVATILLL